MRSFKYQGNLTHFKKQEFTAAQALVIFEVAEVFVSSTRSSASDTLPPYVSPIWPHEKASEEPWTIVP